jgi:beta-galactosidase
LNGRSLGTKSPPNLLEPVLRWDVPNEAGVVRAVGQWAGKPGECAHFELATAGAPARLELAADPFDLAAGPELISIEIRIVDAAGHRVFGAALPISVAVTGPGELAALDNSDPRDVASVQAGHRTAYQGRILALVRTGSEAGFVTVLASANGLPAAELRLQRTLPGIRRF